MLRSLLLTFGLLLTLSGAEQPASGATAQQAHATGICGSLGPGTGLRDGKGWIVSMLPGKHEFRMRGAGNVYVTVARLRAMDLDAARPYYIVIEESGPESELQWLVPGGAWAPVAKTFLYPPQGTS